MRVADAEGHGRRVASLVEEVLRGSENILGVSLEILSSMRVLVSGAPAKVKDRVQIVLSQLVSLCRELDGKQDISVAEKDQLTEVVKSIGAVAETLVNWRNRPKQPIRICYLGHVTGYQLIRDHYFLIRSVPEELVTKFRRQRSLTGTLVLISSISEAVNNLADACRERLKGDMALKRAESMALRPGGPLPCSSALKQSIVELTVTIDSENSSQFEIKVKVMSGATVRFLLKKLSQQVGISSQALSLLVEGKNVTQDFTLRAGDLVGKHITATESEVKENNDDQRAQAVNNLADACRERLKGDMALKRAESMALRPGGPLPCSSALKQSIVELTVTIDSENSSQFEIKVKVMSGATVRFLLKKLSQQVGISSQALSLLVEGKNVTQDFTLRAGDLVGKHITATESEVKENNDDQRSASPEREGDFVRAVYTFKVDSGPRYLEFIVGDMILVTKKSRDGWWEGRMNDKTGTFPASFVEELSEKQVLTAMTKIPLSNTTTPGKRAMGNEFKTPESKKSRSKYRDLVSSLTPSRLFSSSSSCEKITTPTKRRIEVDCATLYLRNSAGSRSEGYETAFLSRAICCQANALTGSLWIVRNESYVNR
eukprot:sb/3463198/